MMLPEDEGLLVQRQRSHITNDTSSGMSMNTVASIPFAL